MAGEMVSPVDHHAGHAGHAGHDGRVGDAGGGHGDVIFLFEEEKDNFVPSE